MIKVIRSQKRNNEFWARRPDADFCADYRADVPTVAVNSAYKFQTHFGFGGAFTEAAAYTLAEAGEKVRDEAAKAYYSADGLNYNLGRMSVHSCDFGLGNYTYIKEGDAELKTFDMSHEDKWVVPFINAAKKAHGGEIKMFASSWSPPAFMKTNNEMNYGGRLKPEFKNAWAEYNAKFILGMRERGVEIFSIASQNEPEAVQTWESHSLSAAEEADFIADYLAPALKKHGLDTKIIVWDHNRDRMVRRAAETLKNKKARDASWGVGYHWYVSEEHKNLSALHALYPDKHILLTECCVELKNTAAQSEQGKTAYIGNYKNGEKYGREIIGDFNNFSEGWIDWNLVLNEEGGPNHVSNFCEAPVMYDRKLKKLIYNNSYYYIGHFSKFITPGAKRLMCCNDIEKEVYSVAYENTDGDIVVVIQNEGWIKELALVIDGKGLNVTVPDCSITTFIYKK